MAKYKNQEQGENIRRFVHDYYLPRDGAKFLDETCTIRTKKKKLSDNSVAFDKIASYTVKYLSYIQGTCKAAEVDGLEDILWYGNVA